jgi:hypothetical protein
MELARKFLEAARECVNTLGRGRTTSTVQTFYGGITRWSCIVTGARSVMKSDERNYCLRLGRAARHNSPVAMNAMLEGSGTGAVSAEMIRVSGVPGGGKALPEDP